MHWEHAVSQFTAPGFSKDAYKPTRVLSVATDMTRQFVLKKFDGWHVCLLVWQSLVIKPLRRPPRRKAWGSENPRSERRQ